MIWVFAFVFGAFEFIYYSGFRLADRSYRLHGIMFTYVDKLYASVYLWN